MPPPKEGEEEDVYLKKFLTERNKLRVAGFAVCKYYPETYLIDFPKIKRIVEEDPTEEKIEEWLNNLPPYLNAFYNTVIRKLWSSSCGRYTTAQMVTGKAWGQSKN